MKQTFSRAQLSAAGTLTLGLGFTANYVFHLFNGQITGRRDILFLALCALIDVAILLVVSSERWRGRLRPVANAWTASLGLVAAPWIFSKLDAVALQPLVKTSLAAAGVALVFAVAWVAERAGGGRDRIIPQRRRAAAFLGLAVLLILGLNLILVQKPLVGPPSTAVLAAGSHPNIVLVSLDTVRADHLSVYGYQRDTTPNLRKFAREATVYTNAISSGNMTLSSHASLFTGLYPSRHGAHLITGRSVNSELGAELPGSIPTLAGILSGKGYATLGVVANLGYLRHNYGLNHGFQYYDQSDPVELLASGADLFYIRDGICALLQHFSSPAEFERPYRRAGEINREAFRKLKDAQTAGRPFFLFVNYMDAHEPYFPPRPFDSRYPGKDPRLHAGRYLEEADEVLALRRSYSAQDRRRDISQYDGGIAYLDYQVGELIARLKSMKLYDNTIVVITSDHGQAFGERNLVGHCSSVYQDQVYVPLLIHFPRRQEAKVVERRVGGVDVMPTLLEAAGYPLPSGLDGRSFYKAGQGSESVVSESYPDDHRVSLNPRLNRIERAIFDGHYKFISSTLGKRELYDLSTDPNETRNLYRPDDKTSRELEDKLAAWVSTHAHSAGRRVQADPALRERLKSLGYVQ